MRPIYALPSGEQKLKNFKLTPSLGYGYKIKINEKWSYQPGICLGDLGSNIYISDVEPEKTIISIYAASLDQFIDYKPLKWLSFGISPSIYYVGFARIQEPGYTDWTNFDGGLKRLVFSVVPRIAFHPKRRWSVELFYRNDLNNLTTGGNQNKPPPVIGLYSLRFKGYGVGLNLKYKLMSKAKVQN